ncbi:Ovarian tumor, otubain [Kalmanozyma brasiliensis GHG001]|uniref:OTU domain-containing protein n=1 Tax=Kalmanozyma brasiliensis (strain GHG001) TaxID=1365824 RepID=V5EUR2_KALBG|nr:Ovarian tumor, otubain [Kalmanozyma brasiliensis GHG001]EST05889.1 Ovarian tumor, otubain [Kalmanozyma brasiliensis GHG001]
MGRPPRNAAAGPSRRSARPASTIKNERITRSSRSKNSHALDDPEQVERDLNAQLKRMGLYAANTTGDGNCLFRALSDQLYGHSSSHAQLRQETCDHLAARPEKFAGFVDDKPFDQYVRLMRENGTYGGHLELHAFAQMKQKQIKIVQPGLVYVVEDVDDSPEARRAREHKEQERLRVQNTIQAGTEGAPLTERQRRRQKREDTKRDKKSSQLSATDEASTSATTAASTSATASASAEAPAPTATSSDPSIAEASDLASSSQASSSTLASPREATASSSPAQPAEAYGPLYIAYHNWEHYSSIRNLDGPHSGLPRIKEQIIAAAAGSAAADEDSKASAKGASNPTEPTLEEKMVLQSVSGDHDLDEIRQLLSENENKWDQVVELILEKDAAIDEEEAVGAELQALPSSGDLSTASNRLAVPPPPPLPDHMRHWRATSPSSVDTSATHSSGEGDSPSTTATTDDGGDVTACASPDASSLSRGSTPGVERLSSKRAASSDAMTMSMIRSPKRRSQSRSPEFDAEAESQSGKTEATTAASQAAAEPRDDEPETYEIIKRGRGRPRKDGLPNKSTIVRRVPTAREKRDAAQARKRERQLEKVTRSREAAKANSKTDKGGAAATTNRPSPAEVCGFRELKI